MTLDPHQITKISKIAYSDKKNVSTSAQVSGLY